MKFLVGIIIPLLSDWGWVKNPLLSETKMRPFNKKIRVCFFVNNRYVILLSMKRTRIL